MENKEKPKKAPDQLSKWEEHEREMGSGGPLIAFATFLIIAALTASVLFFIYFKIL